MTESPTKLVILMEDKDDIARLIAHHLERSGFRVRRPQSAFDLISEAEKEQPALFNSGSYAAGYRWISTLPRSKSACKFEDCPNFGSYCKDWSRGQKTCFGKRCRLLRHQTI